MICCDFKIGRLGARHKRDLEGRPQQLLFALVHILKVLLRLETVASDAGVR